MSISKSFLSIKNVFILLLEKLFNIITPEGKRLESLLRLDEDSMRMLLPKSKVEVKDLHVLFDYRNQIIRLIIKSIKYKNNYSLRKRVAKYLKEDLIDIASEITLWSGKIPIVVPMPMSREERRKKGFNQCEELLKEIEKDMGKINENFEISYNTLKKVRETKRQTILSKEERLENVKNSMEATQSAENRSVIVVDDVYTTLASFSEARRALLEAGALRSVGVFLAH